LEPDEAISIVNCFPESIFLIFVVLLLYFLILGGSTGEYLGFLLSTSNALNGSCSSITFYKKHSAIPKQYKKVSLNTTMKVSTDTTKQYHSDLNKILKKGTPTAVV